MNKTRIRHIYDGMKQRCYNCNSSNYPRYGGRGICICDEWMGDRGFENFCEWAVNNGYEDALTIDRIDVNGNYCPENCRWITRSSNSSRKRKYGHVENGLIPANRNIIIGRATKSGDPEYYNYKISLPADMVKEIGVAQEDRGVVVSLSDGKIIIEKKTK